MSGKLRVGVGYDAHPLVAGRKLVLGGVEIPFEKGLKGHSDADVLTHAIIESLLGAAALGDIGSHFPPEDPQYKNISSLLLLERALALLRQKGYRVQNIDATVVARAPRLRDWTGPMRQNLSLKMDIPVEQISIKASTFNGLGFAGRGEGITAIATALIETN